jgi:hypothetical protein
MSVTAMMPVTSKLNILRLRWVLTDQCETI